MSLKTDLQNKLKEYQAKREKSEKEIAELEEEIKCCELLMNRAEKGMFQKGETVLTEEETEDLQYEILALKDILVMYKSERDRSVMDTHLTQAKMEVLETK